MGTTRAQVPKLDLRKRHKELYSPSVGKVEVVDVPELPFILLDGRLPAGVRPSDSESFKDAMSAMYGVAYGLKFMSKLRDVDPIDFTVMAMEGLWSTESGEFDWNREDDPWLYTLIMLQPEHITDRMVQEAVHDVGVKKPNPKVQEIRFERWREGPAIQIMHIGPYAAETKTIEKMDAFAEANGYELHGRHHEIYMGDPTRAKPENLRTILRHPIKS